MENHFALVAMHPAPYPKITPQLPPSPAQPQDISLLLPTVGAGQGLNP